MFMNRKTSRTHGHTVFQRFVFAALIFINILAGCSNAPTIETCTDVTNATTRGGAEPSASSQGSLVRRVIDGDTIVLANGSRVRYIGIDTPERGEPFFDEATEYNRRLVEGARVQMVKDESDKDRFGRLLRYVLAGDILVNAELVREGLAEAKRYEPDVKFAGCFDGLMQEARDAERGMWEP